MRLLASGRDFATTRADCQSAAGYHPAPKSGIATTKGLCGAANLGCSRLSSRLVGIVRLGAGRLQSRPQAGLPAPRFRCGMQRFSGLVVQSSIAATNSLVGGKQTSVLRPGRPIANRQVANLPHIFCRMQESLGLAVQRWIVLTIALAAVTVGCKMPGE